MSPLRHRMIEAMRLRGFAERTHESYLHAVEAFARYHRKSPDTLDSDAVQAFLSHLALDRGLAGASCRLYLNGLRFFYLKVLNWPHFDVPVAIPKKPQRIPELLTRVEVRALLEASDNPKHRTLLTVCYGCGLRVSELVALKVRHLDGERSLLRVDQGKGAKDRLVTVPPLLMEKLRAYWRVYRPTLHLFPGPQPGRPLGINTAQRAYQGAKARAGIDKVGGIHSLRHAYATHQLDAGMPVHVLQRQLGHGSLQSTMRYLHWVPDYRGRDGHATDLVAALESPS
jgi:integrase/recombinase XerD